MIVQSKKYLSQSLNSNYTIMSKYSIEVKQLFEPFVYETTEGIMQVYKKTQHKCPINIIDVLQWGDTQWTSMEEMFQNCDEITTFSAKDVPDLSQCTNMRRMFEWAINFNQDIGNWDVSSVIDMKSMFRYAENFNQDIGDWDVSNVTDMREMFYNAEAFNQDIGNWNVSNVANMADMFYNAEAFNQDIGNWDVSSVTNMYSMFRYAEAFNQDISNWDVSNVTNMSYMFPVCPIQETFKPKFKF